MDNEEKYIDIADKLRKLEKVEASHNFTHNLQAKIIEFESEKRKEHSKRNEDSKGGFLKDLFGNLQYPWLVPAAGFTILIFFVFYITYQNKSVLEADNNASLKNEQQTIQSEKQIKPTEPGNSSDNQAPPVITEKKELTRDIKPQNQQNTTGNDFNNERSIPKNNMTIDKSDSKPIYKNEAALPDKKVSKELLKSDDQNNISGVESFSENQGKVSEEKSRTMANVKPETKDTNKGKKNKNDNAGSILLKMNRIDKEALERIQEEISK
ncbi:MAG: hypothetical protein R3A12_15460 [Ignavibacteria bacterium]